MDYHYQMEMAQDNAVVRADTGRPVETSDDEKRLIIAFTAVIWTVWLVVQTVTRNNWNGIAVFVPGIPAIVLLWVIARSFRKLPLLLIIIIGPILCLGIEIVHLETISIVTTGVYSWRSSNFVLSQYAFTVYLWSLFYLTWYLGYFSIANYYRYMRETLQAAEIRSQTNKAHLQMLRYQLNPHFLFNTLNSISSLVLDEKNADAEDTIGNLSGFLRFSLDKKAGARISLSEEIGVTKKYLAIEKMRFSDKLDIEYDLDPNTLTCLVPSLILQPIIENSIKHAISPKKTGGHIAVRSSIENQKLVLCVSDNGPGVCEIKNLRKLPLSTVRARLASMYRGKGDLDVTTSSDGGTVVKISIPLQREPRNQ